MRLPFKQIKKMTVETLSGTKLGKVQDLLIDDEEQRVIQYEVKHTGISGNNYLIHRDQVVRFEEKKMIVYDTVLGKKEKVLPPPLKVATDGGVALRHN